MIPIAETKLNKKQRQKELADKYYRINVDLSRRLKELIGGMELEKLEESFLAYMVLMNPPEDAGDQIQVDREVLQNLALLSATTLSRLLVTKIRGT